MRKVWCLSRRLLVASLILWAICTKAHPGYDMVLCGQAIGPVKNRTQAEDILAIIRYETDNRDLPFSLYLRFFRKPVYTDVAALLERARLASGALDKTEETASPSAEPSMEATTPIPALFSSPLDSLVISSPFGMRDGRIHEGVDLAADYGTPVLAAAAGTVTYSGVADGYGNLLILHHENGYESYYAHCAELYVSFGDTVVQGEKIAAVGSTGNSTGPHLHFEIRRDGASLDPLPYLPDASF